MTQGDDTQIGPLPASTRSSGRLAIERTVYRDGQVRRSTHFIRACGTPPEWVVLALEAAGFSDVRVHRPSVGGALEL